MKTIWKSIKIQVQFKIACFETNCVVVKLSEYEIIPYLFLNFISVYTIDILIKKLPFYFDLFATYSVFTIKMQFYFIYLFKK